MVKRWKVITFSVHTYLCSKNAIFMDFKNSASNFGLLFPHSLNDQQHWLIICNRWPEWERVICKPQKYNYLKYAHLESIYGMYASHIYNCCTLIPLSQSLTLLGILLGDPTRLTSGQPLSISWSLVPQNCTGRPISVVWLTRYSWNKW